MIDIIVVTYDAEGSRIYTDKEEFAIPVVSVKAVDPTGAGDAYRAGFLLAFTQRILSFHMRKNRINCSLFCRTDTGLPDRPSDLGRNESPL